MNVRTTKRIWEFKTALLTLTLLLGLLFGSHTALADSTSTSCNDGVCVTETCVGDNCSTSTSTGGTTDDADDVDDDADDVDDDADDVDDGGGSGNGGNNNDGDGIINS